MPKAPKKKRGFMDGYKTYDPSTEGFGSIEDWGAAFKDRMGYEEAETYFKANSEDPLVIMGFTSLPDMDTLKRAYRKLMLAHQECFRANASVEDQEKAKRIIAAYTVLEERIRRGKK